MENVKATIKGDKLLVEIDLKKELGPSKSGLTTIIGKTAGPELVEGQNEVTMNLQVWRKP